MDLSSLVKLSESELAKVVAERDSVRSELDAILKTVEDDKREALTAEETATVDELIKRGQDAKVSVERAEARLDAAKVAADDEARATRAAATITPTETRKPAYDEVVRTGSEPHTYTKQTDPGGKQFLSDVGKQFLYRDNGACDRLERHMREEQVDRGATAKPLEQRTAGNTGTGNFTGLVVPQYLVDMVAPAVADLRPFADACANNHPLPSDGMTVNISRITTPTSDSLQVDELDAASAQTIDDTILTVPVLTASGQQTVSRQAIDRGTAIEDTVLQDMFARYNTMIDNTVINQSSTGLTNICGSTAGAYASGLTGPGLYSKILGAAAAVEQTLLAYGRPTHVVMDSARWYWLAAQMASTWPMINSAPVPDRTIGTLDAASAYNSGIRGVLPNGLLVVVDNNVPNNLGGSSNQDEIYVVPSREFHLWEEPGNPVYIRAEQPAAANLGILMVVYGYFAYTFQRYTDAFQKVSGAALTTPEF